MSEDNKCRQIQSFGTNPGPLCNATLSAIGNNLFLFGGLNRETGWNNKMWIFDTGFSNNYFYVYDFIECSFFIIYYLWV